jgi:hypothetical protein
MDKRTEYKSKIITVFNSTTRDNLDNGMTWYRQAFDHAILLNKKHGIGIVKTVGILAALSPNNKWARNKIDADLFLSNPSLDTKVCTFMGQREKALAIYNCNGYPLEVECILNGVKTCNFFNNILFFASCDRVTVDMWAFRSVGAEEKLKNVPLVTQAYTEVAQELNIQPHQLQAVVWGVVRGNAS